MASRKKTGAGTATTLAAADELEQEELPVGFAASSGVIQGIWAHNTLGKGLQYTVRNKLIREKHTLKIKCAHRPAECSLCLVARGTAELKGLQVQVEEVNFCCTCTPSDKAPSDKARKRNVHYPPVCYLCTKNPSNTSLQSCNHCKNPNCSSVNAVVVQGTQLCNNCENQRRGANGIGSRKRTAEAKGKAKADDLTDVWESQPACARSRAIMPEVAPCTFQATLDNVHILCAESSLTIANEKIMEAERDRQRRKTRCDSEPPKLSRRRGQKTGGDSEPPELSQSSNRNNSKNKDGDDESGKGRGVTKKGGDKYDIIYNDFKQWKDLREDNWQDVLPPIHQYDKIQACDVDLAAEKRVKMVGALGHADFGKELEAFAPSKSTWQVAHSFEKLPLFRVLRGKCIRHMKSRNNVFTGAAFAGAGLGKSSKKYKDTLKAVRDNPTPSNPALNPHWTYALGAAAVHKQQDHQLNTSTIYIPHIDTIASNVAFVPLQGYSYNFIAVWCPELEEPVYEDTPDWRLYQKWKKTRPDAEKEKLGNGEQMLIEFIKARSQNHQKILTYKLEVGQVLMFAAGFYPHFTIIPAQDKLRILAVMHELIEKKAVGKTRNT